MKAFYIALRSFFAITFPNLFKNKEIYVIAGESLWKGKSFRLLEEEHRSITLYFKEYLKHSVGIWFTSAEKYKVEEGEKGGWDIYDYHAQEEAFRKAYIQYFAPEVPLGRFIAKGRLGIAHLSFYEKIWVWIGVQCLFIFSVWGIWKTKGRGNRTLLFKQWVELYALLNYQKNNISKKLVYFCISEIDANWSWVALQQMGIEVWKVCSEVPLAFWNKRLLTDVLVVCNACQHKEAEAFQQVIFKRKIDWGPEYVHQYAGMYEHKYGQIAEGAADIGFYSTASWVRSAMGHIDQGYDMEEGETRVKRLIRNFSEKHQVLVGVFLHPKEKKFRPFEKVKEHYDAVLGEGQYFFYDKETASSKLFDHAKLGVAFESTIVYERLFFGYKTVMYPNRFEGFPIEGSGLASISAENDAAFEAMLAEGLTLETYAFFERHGLVEQIGGRFQKKMGHF